MSHAIPLTQSPPALGFFQRDLPAYAILAAFLVLTLPLALLYAIDPDAPRIRAIMLVYIVVLGMSHFVLTPTVYLQSSNLRYFNGSWRNRIIYFAIPIAIFLFFDLSATFQVAVLFPLVAMLVRTAIRLFDFQHFSRQTFGVLQLYKVRAGCKFPAWSKRVETLYYFALSLLLLTTFLGGGHFTFDQIPAVLVGLVAIALFMAMLTAFVITHQRSTNRTAIVLPLLYFLFQTAAALLAAYDLMFYGLA